MKLTQRGFKRLNQHEYGDWRENGLAFHLTRQDYTQPNRTLASAFVFQNPMEQNKLVVVIGVIL